jgi:hypothetical protein|tara:strand:+ start:357 stop:533 length:177 start_codon:yes stop_codon:yes gene_type:complete
VRIPKSGKVIRLLTYRLYTLSERNNRPIKPPSNKQNNTWPITLVSRETGGTDEQTGMD